MSVKFCQNVGNNEYITLLKFWWPYHERFQVIEGAPGAPPGRSKQTKSPVWLGLISGHLSGPSNLPTRVKGGKENNTYHLSFIFEWLSGWPSLEPIQDFIASGFHLVAKAASSYETANGSSWRLSFSEVEKKLFKWSANAYSCLNEVLRRLKTIIKANNWYPLTSYHMKTILFYECEAKPHPFLWGFDQLSYRLIDCLLRLKQSLITGFCPNYFMRIINQFESFPPHERYRLTAEVHQHLTYQHIYPGFWLAAEPSLAFVQYIYPPTPLPCYV